MKPDWIDVHRAAHRARNELMASYANELAAAVARWTEALAIAVGRALRRSLRPRRRQRGPAAAR